jgi:hypothetical protein
MTDEELDRAYRMGVSTTFDTSIEKPRASNDRLDLLMLSRSPDVGLAGPPMQTEPRIAPRPAEFDIRK